MATWACHRPRRGAHHSALAARRCLDVLASALSSTNARSQLQDKAVLVSFQPRRMKLAWSNSSKKKLAWTNSSKKNLRGRRGSADVQ